ncbi:hypothetical protein SDC9_113944 [bioreactor metagenome]|uniref:HTH cro/C1-type domain-containing protein n=3 Tax=root TaxID=1 RepID=A0A212KL64_9BACT|nr:helix-turn-helix transcriptional regulator [Desulfovibrio desulfuricans]SBW12443.1 conserved hypothetical protein [uncultured Desulfovibrio sp.]
MALNRGLSRSITVVLNSSYGRDNTKKIMGLIVQSLREGLGMSRYALAKEAGVDSSWLRRFEQGKSGIRVETLITLARGLKIPAAAIVTAMEKALESTER